MLRRTPSRRMPPAPEPPMVSPGTLAGCLIAVAGAIGGVCWYEPWALLVVAFLAVVVIAAIFVSEEADERRRALAAERSGESICTFARALDFRAIDTWIIRAVYEELGKACPGLPIRPGDRLGADLLIDDDDLDYLAADMARRAGRQWPSTERNPYCGRVETAHDLVRLLTHQPRTEIA